MAILIFGEVLPKQFAIPEQRMDMPADRRNHTTSFLRFPPGYRIHQCILPLAQPLRPTEEPQLFHPGRYPAHGETRREYRDPGELQDPDGAIGVPLQRCHGSAIMTHRKDVFSLEKDLSVEKGLPKIAEVAHSRVPVYDEHPENIVGVVLENDLMRAFARGELSGTIGDYMVPAVYIPETWKIHRVFRKLKEEVLNLAIVLDEYGGLAGIVTMEDLVEESSAKSGMRMKSRMRRKS
jgi:Mg2+/Co2+ transporter CorB